MSVTGVSSFVKTVCFIMGCIHYVTSSDMVSTVSTNKRTQMLQCIMRICLHIHAVKNTSVCRVVSLCNMHHNVIYIYMFRPCKWAIIRLFVEPVR